jgi:hypothetical protein
MRCRCDTAARQVRRDGPGDTGKARGVNEVVER